MISLHFVVACYPISPLNVYSSAGNEMSSANCRSMHLIVYIDDLMVVVSCRQIIGVRIL